MHKLPRAEIDGYEIRYGKPLFSSLWEKALGAQYPVEVQPYSSCTYELLDQLAEQLDCSERSRIVDLGCGAGGVSLWIARELGCDVIGIDRSRSAIEIAKARGKEWGISASNEFYEAHFCDLPFPSGSVDSAFSVDALPFAKDIDDALAEVRRVLRSNGRLVFTTRESRMSSPRYDELGPLWSKVLTRNGFQTIATFERKEVSGLWEAVYQQWLLHESDLRAELSDDMVDHMIDEVERVAPTLKEARPWLLITALAES